MSIYSTWIQYVLTCDDNFYVICSYILSRRNMITCTTLFVKLVTHVSWFNTLLIHKHKLFNILPSNRFNIVSSRPKIIITLVLFTKIRKLVGLKPPALHNETVRLSQDPKFLGMVLHSKLTWNQHLKHMTNKRALTTRKTIEKTWGLKPCMMYGLYTVVVRSMLTYDCLNRWTKTTQKQEIANLQKCRGWPVYALLKLQKVYQHLLWKPC